jgi:hypothetical protein
VTATEVKQLPRGHAVVFSSLARLGTDKAVEYNTTYIIHSSGDVEVHNSLHFVEQFQPTSPPKFKHPKDRSLHGTVRVFAIDSAVLWLASLGCGTVRVFDRNFHSRMPLSFTPLLHLKRCHACDQWHSFLVFTPLTGWHCKFRPNTEGFQLRQEEKKKHAHVKLGMRKGMGKKHVTAKTVDPCDSLPRMGWTLTMPKSFNLVSW